MKYDNPQVADQAAEDMARIYRVEFRAYFCNRCDAWHVGRPDPERKTE